MDGTLLDLHFDNYFWLEHMPKRYAEKNKLSYDQSSDILMQLSKSTQGTLNWYCLDYWTEKLDMDIVALKHEIANRITIRKNVIPFLKHLKTLNKNIILLTNAHNNSVKLKFGYVQIEEYFDKVITSHEIGLAKEENGFWEALAKYESFEKNNSLFVDDNLDVLDNANQYGIKHLFTISQPDSQKPHINRSNYIAIEDYQQLIY